MFNHARYRQLASLFASLAIALYCIAGYAQVDAPGEPASAAIDVEAAGDGRVPALTDEAPIPTRSLWDMFIAGGVFMWPILACSVVLMIFVFERSVSLRKGRVIPGPFVTRFLQQIREGQLDREQALELCSENGSPVAHVFAGAVRKWGKPAVEVEQAFIDEGERISNHLNRYLRVINGVSTVGPLLGLLGTVWGMIDAFNAISTSEAMGRPELLAGGISQALVTTAAGLLVAIPALILYLYFVGRVDSLIMQIDELGQELINLISAEGQSERTKPRKKSAAAAA